MQACENELGMLTVQPAWRCVHQTNVTSRGTLVVFSVRVETRRSDELDVRVSVFMPQRITSEREAYAAVHPRFKIIVDALKPQITASSDRDTRDACDALYGDGMHTAFDGMHIEHVVPIDVGPDPEPLLCAVVDYYVGANFD